MLRVARAVRLRPCQSSSGPSKSCSPSWKPTDRSRDSPSSPGASGAEGAHSWRGPPRTQSRKAGRILPPDCTFHNLQKDLFFK
ncbi:hypothetical protein VULLAG_LOCUS17782 [Vulpes lagopus]